MTNLQITTSVFVYGTLKRGQCRDRFCRDAVRIRPARLWARLYDLPAGYPAIEIPACAAFVGATGNPEADARAEAARSPKSTLVWARPTGDWDLIHGELVSFAGASILATLDQVEGFHAGRHSLYQRSLVPVHVEGKQELAWTYHMLRVNGTRIGERWPPSRQLVDQCKPEQLTIIPGS